MKDGKSSKDKGYSLRDWFKGGGWKQTGGKYDGKPCAKQVDGNKLVVSMMGNHVLNSQVKPQNLTAVIPMIVQQ